MLFLPNSALSSFSRTGPLPEWALGNAPELRLFLLLSGPAGFVSETAHLSALSSNIVAQVSLDHYRRESMKVIRMFQEGLPSSEIGAHLCLPDV